MRETEKLVKKKNMKIRKSAGNQELISRTF